MARTKTAPEAEITLDELKEEILRDYALCITSREASLIGRKEVLGGKAKFGIFGDGKELAQVCMAKQFRNGDWRTVGERFKQRGRMIPEGSGVRYVTSWMGADGSCCYQVMEAPDRAALDGWIARWSDLVDFEVYAVTTSADAAARAAAGAQ